MTDGREVPVCPVSVHDRNAREDWRGRFHRHRPWVEGGLELAECLACAGTWAMPLEGVSLGLQDGVEGDGGGAP